MIFDALLLIGFAGSFIILGMVIFECLFKKRVEEISKIIVHKTLLRLQDEAEKEKNQKEAVDG